MNEQLQQELAAWLAQLRDAADAGASFALEQAPLVVQEKVLYGRIVHSVEAIGFFVAAVLIAYAIYRVIEWLDDEAALALLPTFGGLGVLFLLVLATSSARLAVMAWIAPRLYVVEWLARLLK